MHLNAYATGRHRYLIAQKVTPHLSLSSLAPSFRTFQSCQPLLHGYHLTLPRSSLIPTSLPFVLYLQAGGYDSPETRVLWFN